MRFADKVAIITGGGAGFGEAMARRFAEEGAKVVVADINDEHGQRVADDIGADARFVHTDVSQDADVAAMVDTAVSNFGRLDVMVNNAGYTHPNGPMLDVSEDLFDRVFAVNVKSIYLSACHAVPVFRAGGGGVILNIASTAGVRPRPGLVWYCSSKGTVITMTKAMAIELASDGIRVCALNPVAGETAMLKHFMGEDTPQRRQQFVDTIPLGRFSLPADIANAALFLCSDEAAMMTGNCLEVDGGRCI